MTWAETIRLARHGMGITQEDMARLLGVCWTTVSRWERGEAMPSQRKREFFINKIKEGV